MSPDRFTREAEFVYYSAPLYDMRTGELLFDHLRHEIAEVVRDTPLDTFYEELEFEEVEEWLRKHIVYDNDGRMVRLHDDRGVLWEERYAA